MRTNMRDYLADVRKIETYPLGPDDPALPEELHWSAQIMRTVRDLDPARLDAIQRDQIAKVLKGYDPGQIEEMRPQIDDKTGRTRSRAP